MTHHNKHHSYKFALHGHSLLQTKLSSAYSFFVFARCTWKEVKTWSRSGASISSSFVGFSLPMFPTSSSYLSESFLLVSFFLLDANAENIWGVYFQSESSPLFSISGFCGKTNLCDLLRQVWVSVRAYLTSLPPETHRRISIYFQTESSPKWLYFQNKLSPSNLCGLSSDIQKGIFTPRVITFFCWMSRVRFLIKM
mgnify:CR=1 FL=1